MKSINVSFLKMIGLFAILSQLIYCTHAVDHIESHAKTHQLTPLLFKRTEIPVKALINHSNTPQKTVYIYLEGDGRPWEPHKPAKNPNTRNAISLPLMTIAQRDALYLFRPCYGWREMPTNCDASLWTSARYSQGAVDTLNSAIEQHQLQFGTKRYIIVGHSGGATLALLLAAQRNDIAAVVSIAGNINHNAWTRYFNYLPLNESLTLPSREQYPNEQMHWYLIGKQDKVLPPQLQSPFIPKHQNNIVKYYDDFTHSCCWEKIWPQIIHEIEQILLTRQLNRSS